MSESESSVEAYRQLLLQTRDLYRSSAQQIVREHPYLVRKGTDYVELLDDLHRGVVMQVYLTVSKADHQWTAGETELAAALCEHLWGRRLKGASLNRAIGHAAQKCEALEWGSLVRPFSHLEPLRDRAPELETLVVRQSNVVARIDGVVAASELAAIKRITEQLEEHLGPSTAEPAAPVPWPPPVKIDASPEEKDAGAPTEPTEAEATRTLEDVLADLDGLVGLASAKEELRSLANYISLQKRRGDAGLPATEISLHLVFTGNPGTGKTTVARLFGEAMRAMGVLPEGQLIETDRSGLVAEYAGQTGPKANRKIDEAMGGVLFIDEAYGLVDTEADDPFGREAMQTLLKRAEDDRTRLSVVLAGYPNEMTRLLESNPGLASRFSRTLRFDDYSPLELCRIFGRLLEQQHYRLAPAARLRVVEAIAAMHGARDRHFGNGRSVRNLFEQAILRMANRLATIVELSDEGLVTFEADDIPCESEASSPDRIRVACPSCEYTKDTTPDVLGASVRCPKCQERFQIEWCELVT